VLQAGSGIFYDRFTAALLMNATLLNGINQTQYIIRNPLFYPNIPDPATLAALSAQQAGTDTAAIYQVDSRLRAPYMIQASGSVERQLPHGLSMALTYTTTRGVHQLLTRDINAPLPTEFNSIGQAIGPGPSALLREIFTNMREAASSGRMPWRIRMAPFIFMQSGLPYNLIAGVDTNNDGNPNDDRPAFAQNLSRPSVD